RPASGGSRRWCRRAGTWRAPVRGWAVRSPPPRVTRRRPRGRGTLPLLDLERSEEEPVGSVVRAGGDLQALAVAPRPEADEDPVRASGRGHERSVDVRHVPDVLAG